MNEVKYRTLSLLLELKDRKLYAANSMPYAGLCSYLSDGLYDVVNYKESEIIIKGLFLGWEYHTGCEDFIVPATKCDRSKEAANDAYKGCTTRFWVEGEYAELRWDLVNYCINKLQGELS